MIFCHVNKSFVNGIRCRNLILKLIPIHKQLNIDNVNYSFYCTTPKNEETSTQNNYLNYPWDLKGLKSETSRIYLRTFKKIAKLNEKLSTGTVPKEETEDSLNEELKNMQTYLSSVGELEIQLKDIRNVNDKKFPTIIKLAVQLAISDKPPPPQVRGEKPKKDKTITPGPRKPYYPYKSLDNIIIRVGREAPDNDLLSCSPKYRDPNHW